MADFDNVAARFKENGVEYVSFEIGPGHVAFLPERGGHLLGPFDRRTGESVFWLNPAFASPGDCRALFERRDWNLGGLRLWIAPEIRYGVKDRTRYWESLEVPRDVEPESCRITKCGDGSLEWGYDLNLASYNPEAGVKKLRVDRRLRPLPDPLAGVPGADGLKLAYFGCVHDTRLEQKTRDGIPAEAWNLVQVKGGGAALVPTTGTFAYVDYYEPLEKSHLALSDRLAKITLDGGKRFKIGVRSHCHFGRIGHVRPVGGQLELIVCSYYNDPGSHYAEQPEGGLDCRGLSMHFYNDGGMFGGFGELEANGRTLGANGYPDAVEDGFSVWCYRGGAADIGKAAEIFLGVKDLT